MTKTVRVVVPLAIILLSACGGSQTGPNMVSLKDPTPISIEDVNSIADLQSAGAVTPRAEYAQEDSAIGAGDLFQSESLAYLTGPRLQTPPTLGSTDLELAIAPDGRAVRIEVAGRTYDLGAGRSNDGEYLIPDPDRGELFIEEGKLVRVYVPNQYVEYFLFELQENGYGIPVPGYPTEPTVPLFDSSGLYVIGFETDPNIIETVTGTATYSGIMSMTLAGLDQYGYAAGSVDLVVDFDTGFLSGDANLIGQAKPGSSTRFDLQVSEINLSIGEAEIVDGAFAGVATFEDNFTMQNPDTDEVIEIAPFDANFDGQFYGPIADSAGGQLSGETVSVGGAEDVAVVGAFIGSR